MQDDNLDDIISSLIDVVDKKETSNNEVVEYSLTGEPVTLTARAAKQVKEIIAHEGVDATLFLRVAVEGGGCSGLSYKLGLDHKSDVDKVYESFGINVIVDPKHIMYLEGIEIDYPDGLDARGFTFDNPKASESCGCGTSFAV